VKPWWKVLGIPRESDRGAIRRAYAQKLRVTHPEDDPQGFMALRQAYEAALSWVDHGGGWTDEDEADDWGARATAIALADESAGAEIDGDPLPPPEPDPEAEARAADRAELQRRTAAFAAALRGPWHGDAAALTAKLDAILTAPAMMEIETREGIENWLAVVLADEIPRSDPVLRAAIDAFGWENEGKHPYAVEQVLRRIDEWRVIQTLRRGDHALSAAWEVLTHEKAPDWRRRIGALRPGIAARVRQLFNLADYQVRGIAHSFDPGAVAWWRAHLEKPRFGFVDLAVMFLAAGLALGLAIWGSTPAIRVGAGVPLLLAAIAFPFVRLRVVMPWRIRRKLEDEEPGWLADAWTMPWLLAGAMLALWPVTPAVAGTVVALSAIGVLWMAVTSARDMSFGSPLSTMFSITVIALIGGAGFFSLDRAAQLALGIFGGASWLVSAANSGGLAAALWRISRWPVLNAVAITVLLMAIPGMRLILPGAPAPLVPVAAAAIAGIVLLGAARDLADGSFAVPLLPWLRLGLWIALVAAALFSAPPVERERIVVDPVTQLEQREPAFAALKQGNPGLYATIEQVRQQVELDLLSRDNASRKIDQLVNTAYRERLPQAPAAMIASELDIRLATMREYRTLDLRACADGGREDGNIELSDGLNKRHYRHALTVAGSAPASAADRKAGRAVSTSELLRAAAAARGEAVSAEALADALRGEEPKAKCDARIALMEALSAQPDADVAQTMRPALTARAEPDSAKKK